MRHRALLAGSGAALLLSCVSPTDGCACSPARTHALVYGTVQSAAGDPVAGAEVRATVFRSVCGEGREDIDPAANPVASDAAGNFRLPFRTDLPPVAACVRVSARTADAADSAVAHVALALRQGGAVPDSARVDLILP